MTVQVTSSKFEKTFLYDFKRLLKADGEVVPLSCRISFVRSDIPDVGRILTLFIKHEMPMSQSLSGMTMLAEDFVRVIESPLSEVVFVNEQQARSKTIEGVDVVDGRPLYTNNKLEIINLVNGELTTLNILFGYVGKNFDHSTIATMSIDHLDQTVEWLSSDT